MNIKKKNKTNEHNDGYTIFLNELTSKFGLGILKRGDEEEIECRKLSTGFLTLDIMLAGGIPEGKIIEIYGHEGTGKTTLALQIIAENQRLNPEFRAVYIDSEHALNFEYASKNININSANFWLSQPKSAEETFDLIEKIIKNQFANIIVIDSIASLVPESEVDSEMGETIVAALARILSSSLKRVIKLLDENNITLICLNQFRSNLKPTLSFAGNNDITCGGKGLKYFSSLRLELTRIAMIKNKDDIDGSAIRIKVIKSKFSKPFQEILLDLYFGKGFSKISTVIEQALKFNIISKLGAWYSKDGVNLAQGKENLISYFDNNKEEMEKLLVLIAEKINLKVN